MALKAEPLQLMTREKALQNFMDMASKITGGAQIVSLLRSNQKVASRSHSEATLKTCFSRRKGAETQLMIRGGKEKRVTMLAAHLYVKAHGKRRFVIAQKFESLDAA